MNEALLLAILAFSNTASLECAESRNLSPIGKTTATRTADTKIALRRRFAAPAARVFTALTTPDLLRQWMSAAGRELVESQVDLRSGGSYRCVFRSSNDSTFGMCGTYPARAPRAAALRSA